MKTIFSSIALLFTTAIFAQTITETRAVENFTGIRTPCGVQVEITQGDVCAVTVEGAADELKDLKTEVLDGTLTIFCSNVDEVKVNVTVKNLRRLDVTGTSTTTTTNKLVTDSLLIIGAGAASMNLDVQATTIKANLNGASGLKISGTTTNLDATLSGASQLKAYQLASESATLTTTGASSAHVNATSSLTITTAGASDVHYTGNPAEKKINSSGGSSVSSREGHTNPADTTSIRVGKYDVHVTETDDDDDNDERSKREKHADDDDFEFWEGIDFGVNGYLTANNKLELPAGFDFLELNYAKSYFFSWNMFQKNIHIYRNNVNLGTGFGLSWYHYNFRNAYTLTPNADYQTATFDSSITYSRNRLGLTYVNVPIFLEFNTNNNDAKNSFHIAGGIEFGYNVFNNLLKQKYEVDGHRIKTRQKDDFNINPFRYDLIGRIGYGDFTIFGKYSLSTLFEKGKGPVVYPFTAGFNITF